MRQSDLDGNAGSTCWVLAGLGLHVPLGLVLDTHPLAAILHAGAALTVGIVVALLGRSWQWAGYAAAYLAGAEVLWRMSGAGVPWEYSKYASAAVLLLALLRPGGGRLHAAAILGFTALLPSSLLTVSSGEWDQVRRSLSFNLSGPLLLAASAWFFYNRKLHWREAARWLAAFAAPSLGVMAVAAQGLLTPGSILFTTESNPALSGGFGPNQVASALGIAALLIMLQSLAWDHAWWGRVVLLALASALALQSALTFSRGGILIAGAAGLISGALLCRGPRFRWWVIGTACAAAVAGSCFVAPKLDAFTGGAINERFHDLSLTNRGQFLLADLELWARHPIFGVGPGGAAKDRTLISGGAQAHTEFSRLLAEHGVGGLIAMVLLAWMGWRALSVNREPAAQALVTALLAWSCLHMAANAMRLAAPAILFGLTQARFLYAGRYAPFCCGHSPRLAQQLVDRRMA